MTPRPAVTVAPALSYQVSSTCSRAIGAAEAFRTVILVMTMSPFAFGLGVDPLERRLAADRRRELLPGEDGGHRRASGRWRRGRFERSARRRAWQPPRSWPRGRNGRASNPPPREYARFQIQDFRFQISASYADVRPGLYLHLAVPVLRLGVDRPEDLHVPFAAAPGLDDLGGDDVDEQLREQPALGVALEVIGGLVPAEVRDRASASGTDRSRRRRRSAGRRGA